MQLQIIWNTDSRFNSFFFSSELVINCLVLPFQLITQCRIALMKRETKYLLCLLCYYITLARFCKLSENEGYFSFIYYHSWYVLVWYRMTEWPMKVIWLPRTRYKLLLKVYKDGDMTASLDNQCQCSVSDI